MDRIDRLMIKAKDLTEPKPMPYELAMRNNPYIGQHWETLLELLSEPLDEWRKVAQAMAWIGGS
ncbi:MAG: hypothetical protein MR380_02150 [Lachnospiraceae bacterium]|nr:hypothetical protein [Lachnospiraceae bacterium]